MTADVAIITAIYNGYEEIKPTFPQDGVEVDWVLVTDQKLPQGYLGWRIDYKPARRQSPFRASKLPKFEPWKYTDAPVSIWLDGSMTVNKSYFAVALMDVCGRRSPILQMPNGDKDCLYQEAESSQDMLKYFREPIREQAEHYRKTGHPSHWGLWMTGLMVRQHTPEVIRFGQEWKSEVKRWSYQCQVSQPYVLRNCGLRPDPLPFVIGNDSWVTCDVSSHIAGYERLMV